MLACECVYTQAAVPLLVDTLSAALPRDGRPRTLIVLYKERGLGDVFFKALGAAGFAGGVAATEGPHTLYVYTRT